MFDVGFGEILVCAIVALLVLGPERLPGAVRTMGRWVGRARHTVNHFTEQIEREMRAEELKRRIDEEIRKTGLEQAKRELEAVRHALDAPVADRPAVGAEHLREPQNSILPPPSPATAGTAPQATGDAPAAPQPPAPGERAP